MNLPHILEKYTSYLKKEKDFNTETLDQCIKFHINQEVKKRLHINPKLSELIDLTGALGCPEHYKDTSLCKYEDILYSYAITVISDFEKGESKHADI